MKMVAASRHASGADVPTHDSPGPIQPRSSQVNDGDTGCLRLTNNVTLRGANGVNATISGGTQLEWGTKNVLNGTITATIDHITFDNVILGAIKIAGAGGDNVISNCECVNYRYGIKVAKDGAFPIVCGSSNVSGALTISGCHFGVPSPTGMPAGGMNHVVHVERASESRAAG